ncbi:alpha/beta hydrolase [Celeribacter litoreus]|uniref:alpha/beta hydrolase n=1 Tax=Celeribacter litoreus TaxID=2876714 RepID=UPI001CCF3ACF|nr:alpha/beta hydrolase [Celeribacter litoreus]MCA0045163.1 alpha/beta hydrolase [Celeribacter litoreus]
MTDYLDTPSGRRIAYNRLDGDGTGVVFLGGFMSDMAGTKAVALEDWARLQGRPFLRFDYSGHGESDGAFRDGCIGDWAEDAQAVIEALTDGPQILVGSSMGGWISLLLCQRMQERVAGLVTIAAAPDFTEDGFWAGFDEAQRSALEIEGVVMVPSGYEDDYPITRRLIEDGRENLILRSSLPLPFPVRFLQGTEDTSVSVETALALFEHAEGEDIRLTLVKGADHSFSTVDCLKTIEVAIFDVLARV